MDYQNTVLFGDALDKLKTIPDETVQMCVTSPPYWGLRDYGHDGQLGLEETPEEYVDNMTKVFREVRRVLKEDGTLWLNIGDSYAGSCMTGGNNGINSQGGKDGFKQSRQFNRKNDVEYLKPKDLCMIPARVAMALQADGWYLRSDIIWHKPNPMPESVKDRPTKAHEYLFLLSKSEKYYYDADAIAEDRVTNESRPDGVTRNRIYKYDSKRNNNPEAYLGNPDQSYRGTKTKGDVPNNGDQQRHDKDIKSGKKRNMRSVWTVNTKPFSEAHFAVYPPELIAPCIKAGSKPYDIVLDPFFGSGTTGEVCQKLNRHYLGIELNREYEPIQFKRLRQNTLQFR